MKILKRLLLGIFIFLSLAVVFLLVAPVIFKDEIIANVQRSINGSINAEVSAGDVNLSFFRSFPKVSLLIEDFAVVGTDTFAGYTLAEGKSAQVDLGLFSVLQGDGNYLIDAVYFDQPTVNLLVLGPDLANYLIVPETDQSAPPEDVAPASAKIELDHFEINQGTFVYDDRTTETYVEIHGLETTGDGDFAATVFDLDTQSEAESLTVRQGGITYLNEVHTVADAIVGVDLDQQRYTFKENEVLLNALPLEFSGSMDLEDNDDIVFDLSYRAPLNEFRQIWSMIPSAYTEGYERIQTSGTFSLEGTVTGPYNGTTNTYPAFTVQSTINDGAVQYPGRPVGLKDINAQLQINSPSSDLDQMVIDIPRLSLNLGGDVFRGNLRLATLNSDPNVNARIDGKIDLNKWSQAIPLEGVRELAGLIVANVTLNNVRQSVLNAGRYDDVGVSGTLDVSDFAYVTDELPPVKIDRASAEFRPQNLAINNFTAQLGRSDLSGSGEITNYLAYFSPEQTMRGNLKLQSTFFDANEWMPAEETEAQDRSPAEMTAASADDAVPFSRFDFDLDASVDQLVYDIYRPENIRAIGNLKPNNLEIATAEARLGNSSFAGSGVIRNLFDYTFGEGVLGGYLSIRSPMLDLADLMDEEVAAPAGEAPAAAAESAVIPVPQDINLTLDVVADKLKYADVNLVDMRGQLLVQEGQAIIDQASAKLLGGRMNFAGAYDTSDPGDPGFRFHYDLLSLDFAEAFRSLNSFAALAPIAKFLEGKFSTDLIVEGKLGQDLFPRLETLDAKGLFETAETSIAGYKPLRVIGQALNIQEFQAGNTLRDIIATFQVEDGQVRIEPFDFRVAGIAMNVQGVHGLNRQMDYQIKADIPREMIKGNIVTGTALAGLDQLANQASRLGINIDPGDVIELGINLTGSLADPKPTFKLLGTNGSAGNLGDVVAGAVEDRVRGEIDTLRSTVEREVNDRVAAVQNQAQQRIDSLRNVAGNRAQAIQDSIRRAAAAEAERLRQEAAARLRNAVGLRRDTTKKDSLQLPTQVGTTVDSLKRELEKFNPFRKKKSGGE
ncbi:AsmA-like C-terminal region-containing protein [Lewinella sp. W8]|uniref:AsmA-like C-terminal region-containing protein n=1 Tax=Lewinella sp. W8 TaxID=2528208 RepID=UPI00106884CF|nr:AsmA-like C-terminal region-containing protein [Lewinella sp. W8]MTB53118.1 hypothetical protein [Lewinella sp. W8]